MEGSRSDGDRSPRTGNGTKESAYATRACSPKPRTCAVRGIHSARPSRIRLKSHSVATRPGQRRIAPPPVWHRARSAASSPSTRHDATYRGMAVGIPFLLPDRPDSGVVHIRRNSLHPRVRGRPTSVRVDGCHALPLPCRMVSAAISPSGSPPNSGCRNVVSARATWRPLSTARDDSSSKRKPNRSPDRWRSIEHTDDASGATPALTRR